MDNQKDFLILDGDCGLCHKLATFMDKRLVDSDRIAYKTRDSIEAKKILKALPKTYHSIDTVYLRKNNSFYIRSAAAIRCLLYLKWYWKIFFPIFWMVPIPIRDLVYVIIAKYRHKFFDKPKVCTFEVD